VTDLVSGAGASHGDAMAARHLAGWLGLAATPSFAVMAVLTALGGAPADMLCSAGHGSLLDGMVPMYLLMSAFHSAAWLKLIAERRRARRRRMHDRRYERLVLRDARARPLFRA
jgi:hypothetical protein